MCEDNLKQKTRKIKEGDLAMIRLSNNPDNPGRQRHYNTWFRVLFVDTDGTFIGEVEKVVWLEFTLYAKGERVRLPQEKVQHVYKEGDQFCYGDNVSICECKGLCLNKY